MPLACVVVPPEQGLDLLAGRLHVSHLRHLRGLGGLERLLRLLRPERHLGLFGLHGLLRLEGLLRPPSALLLRLQFTLVRRHLICRYVFVRSFSLEKYLQCTGCTLYIDDSLKNGLIGFLHSKSLDATESLQYFSLREDM